MKLKFSRRRFLASSTMGAVSAMPFMHALAPEARAAGNAKFLLVFYQPFGVYGPEWYPSAAGRNFTFKKASAPLEAIKDDIIIFSNLDNAMGEKNECANGLDQHQAGVSSLFASATMKPGRFGSGPGAPTIDSVIARHLVPGKHHDDVVVNLGIRSTEHGDHWIRYLFRKTDGAIVESQDDPVKAFRSLFGAGGTATATAMPQKPFSGLKDAMREDLGMFERALAQPERVRFQQYMESFAAFEKSMETELRPENLCKNLPSAEAITEQVVGGHRSSNIWTTAKVQAQLATLALSCGARRVATIHLTDGFRNYLVPPVVTPDTGSFNGHDLSHHTAGGNSTALRTNLNHRHAQYFVELVKGLKTATNPLTGTGSLFDDAVVLWSSCISGAGGGGHSKLKIPFTLAAGRNAGFVTGRHLNANFGTNGMLLRGVCNAFGMPDKTFGDAEFCPSALGGLTEDTAVAGNYPRKVLDYLKLTGRCRGHAT